MPDPGNKSRRHANRKKIEQLTRRYKSLVSAMRVIRACITAHQWKAATDVVDAELRAEGFDPRRPLQGNTAATTPHAAHDECIIDGDPKCMYTPEKQ